MNLFSFEEKLSPLQVTEKARHEAWAFLIPGYRQADRNEKKKLKREFRKMNLTAGCIAQLGESRSFFDDCAVASSKPCPTAKQAAPRKGNDNMYVEQNMVVTEKTAEDTRRSHFLDEISKIFSKRDHELRVKFGLDTPKFPKTPKELVEWIKAGEYTFIKGYDPEADDDEDNWCRYDSPINGLRWTKVKEDRKGYDAAHESLKDEKNKFINEIWAELDPANFIKILEKFEKAKLH